MSASQSVISAMRELSSHDKLSHEALTVVIDHSDSISMVDYNELLAKLQIIDPRDVNDYLDLLGDYPTLRPFFKETIHRLKAKDFYLFIQRVDALWERMNAITNATPAIAWSVLTGMLDRYPEGDPSNINVVLLVNVAVVSAYAASNNRLTLGENPATVYGSYQTARSTTHQSRKDIVEWYVEELNESMIEMAFTHAKKVDALIDIIANKGIWEIEAIRFMLENDQPQEDNGATPLTCHLIAKICKNVDQMITEGTASAESLRELAQYTDSDVWQLARSATQRQLKLVLDARHVGDHESLDIFSTSSYFHRSEGYYTKTLESAITDLRKYGYSDIRSYVTDEKLSLAMSLTQGLQNQTKEKTYAFWSKTVPALRVAVLVGSEEVIRYLSNKQRTVELMEARAIDTPKDLIELVEQMKSIALGDGAL